MNDQFGSNNIPLGNSGIDFKRYLKLFKRKKLLLSVLFIVTFIITVFVVRSVSPKPEYTTNALLQFSDKRELAGEDASGRPENESKVGILKSRIFLTDVAKELNHAFSIKKFDRYDVIDSVLLEEDLKHGSYRLEKENNTLHLYFSNQKQNISDKEVLNMPFPKNRTVEYGGFKVVFNNNFWKENEEIEFSLSKTSNAVENLYTKLDFNFLNRSNTLLSVSFRGTDPLYISEILNTVVDQFVKKNIDFRKFHTKEIITILSEQLASARQSLDSTEQKLKIFREENPWVGLSTDASTALNNANVYESQRLNVRTKKEELERLLSRFNNTSGEQKYPILNEILSFLSAQAVSTVPALTSEFLNLTSERTRLKSQYAETHPVLVENQNKLNNLEQKVLLTLNNQLNTYNSSLRNLNNKIYEQSYKIRNLPEKEMQFAELQRKRNIADELYSSILVRYNQAKLANEVEVGDIIVLDSAVPPQRESQLLLYLRFFIISLIAGLIVSFGAVILTDFMDKTVRSSEELERQIPIKVVAKIPVIGSEKEVPENVFEKANRVDPKLVTTDYSPTPMGEAYRSLRTQLLLAKEHNRIQSLFVSSLNPNEGKSLNAGNLAITFAQQKIPTLLVDADLRRGVLHNSFACSKKPGLSDFIYSNSDINDENVRKIIQQTHVPNLHLISSGMPIPNPSEILGSQRAKDVIKYLSERFGFVIFDTPPISVAVDSVVIARYLDAGLFVVRSGKTNVENVKEKINEYPDYKKEIFGIVLNCAELEIDKSKYTYSYYNY